MKRFRNAALMEDPEIYQVPTYDFELSPASISLGGGGTVTTSTIKTIAYIDPAISEVPSEPVSLFTYVKPISEPIMLTEPIKAVTFIDPVLDAPVSNAVAQSVFTPMPTLLERITKYKEPIVVTPSAQHEPIYIDPALSNPIPILLTEEQLEVVNSSKGIPTVPIEDIVITNTSQEATVPANNIVEKALDTINEAVNEIFTTKVTEDNAVAQDNTGLYLAGAVVALGVLALIFKK